MWSISILHVNPEQPDPRPYPNPNPDPNPLRGSGSAGQPHGSAACFGRDFPKSPGGLKASVNQQTNDRQEDILQDRPAVRSRQSVCHRLYSPERYIIEKKPTYLGKFPVGVLPFPLPCSIYNRKKPTYLVSSCQTREPPGGHYC